MPVIEEDRVLSRLLGALYTEVFQRRTANPNKPLNRSSHLVQEQLVLDDIKTRLEPSTVTYVWGVSGVSDEAGSGIDNVAVRWSFTGQWA